MFAFSLEFFILFSLLSIRLDLSLIELLILSSISDESSFFLLLNLFETYRVSTKLTTSFFLNPLDSDNSFLLSVDWFSILILETSVILLWSWFSFLIILIWPLFSFLFLFLLSCFWFWFLLFWSWFSFIILFILVWPWYSSLFLLFWGWLSFIMLFILFWPWFSFILLFILLSSGLLLFDFFFFLGSNTCSLSLSYPSSSLLSSSLLKTLSSSRSISFWSSFKYFNLPINFLCKNDKRNIIIKISVKTKKNEALPPPHFKTLIFGNLYFPPKTSSKDFFLNLIFSGTSGSNFNGQSHFIL